MKMNKIFCLPILAVVLMAFSCSSEKISGDWVLSVIEKDGVKLDIQSDNLPAINLVENGKNSFKLSGFAGVNNIMGIATSSGKKISFSIDGMTMISGSPDSEAFEKTFLEMLNSVTSAKFGDNDKEILLSNDKNTYFAKFVRASILNKNWNLVSYNDGSAVVSVDLSKNDERPFVEFKNDGIFGFSGVNNFKGSFQVNEKDHSLFISPLASTRKAGSESSMKLEQVFMKNLESAKKYSITGNVLTILDEENTLLTFNAD